VTWGVFTGAITAVLLWLAQEYAKFDPPLPIHDAIVLILAYGMSYLKPRSQA